ncbi:TPR Domain containing protein [Tritrichomonas foetus]|uniref:TPR Domain containing protein n=1 Tax=Tritrichomonas foetus TaxID=1144522 RepID=A0A1J4J4T3_9EUKA|nr:TPR Domain containing protein [Tritrichomonas foetus]|eukprot:OHS93151.1 TPR Domain containing protein [Tritrichomonas foetus]
MECFHERILYYWRHGLYGHVQLLSKIALKTFNNDLFFHVWNSLSLGILGKTEIALNEIARVKCRVYLSLLLFVSQLCIHKHSKSPDIEKIQKLQKKIDKQVKSSNQFCISQSIQVAWMFNNKELTDFLVSYVTETTSIVGWVKLTRDDYNGAEAIFDQVLAVKSNAFDLLALYGRFIIYSATLRSTESMDTYGKILSRYIFPEIDIEKARNSARYGKWDQALTISEVVKNSLPTTFEVDIFACINYLVKCANIRKASEALDSICSIAKEYEEDNWKLNVKLAQSFGTLGCKNLSIIDRTMRLAQIAYNVNPTDQLCSSTLAYHQIITRNFNVAESTLKTIHCHESSIAFLNHLRLLFEMNLDYELEDALDLYEKIQKDFTLYTYHSILARKRDQDTSNFIPLIINSLLNDDNFKKQVYNTMPLEVQYEGFLEIFISLKIDQIFDSLEEIVVMNRSVRAPPTGKIGEDIESIITRISNSIPGYIPLLFVQAALYLKQGRYYESEFLFQTILMSNWQYRGAQCLIFLAMIDSINGKISSAKEKIDEAIILDASLRNDYNYHLVRTAIYKDHQHLLAMVPFFHKQTQPFPSVIEFIDLALSLNAFSIANQIFQIVAPRATHPAEKGALIIRQAKINAGFGNLDRAFHLLEKLKSHSRFVDLATLAESEIRLQYNIGSYLDCIKQLQITEPSLKHCEMCGDAYAKTLNFDEASVWYKNAIDPSQPQADTFQKYISALVSAHRFDDAVNDFTQAFMKLKTNTFTLIFLLKELIKIKRYKAAKQCIETCEKVLNKSNLIIEAEFNYLCAMVSWKLDEFSEAEKFFDNSLQSYKNILKDVSYNTFIHEIQINTASLMIKYGKFSISQLRREKANELFYHAIELDESNSEPVLALVEFYKSRFDVSKCIKLCTDFLDRHPNDERVALELTSLETSDYKKSIECLIRVLKAYPHFHRILVRLVEICARAGKLAIVTKYIPKFDTMPGSTFARGLLLMYWGITNEALICFKKIQNDLRWGPSAKRVIFQLLVNPQRTYIWCHNGALAEEVNLQIATKLIETMDLTENEKLIYLAEIDTSRNTEISVMNAMQKYSLANNDSKSPKIAALTGLARCQIRLGHPHEANVLIDKILNGKPYHETFSYFEEAYLMRAQIVLNEKNFRAAQHFNFQALNLNMSCRKGWELSAESHKQNHMYSEAANAYLRCWNLTGRKDLEVGYQYAFCSMMANRPEEALEMCRIINSMNPMFKDLKEKIVIPAFKKLKP